VVPGEGIGLHLIESKFNQLGFAREEWETYSHWRRRIPREHPEDPVWAGRGRGGSQPARFDPQGITSEDEAQLKTEIQSWLHGPH